MATDNQAGQAMKQLLLIGIGPGDPRQITFEAVEALRRATVFFVLDKGADKDALLQLRKAILERYLPEGAIAWCRSKIPGVTGRPPTMSARCRIGTPSARHCMPA